MPKHRRLLYRLVPITVVCTEVDCLQPFSQQIYLGHLPTPVYACDDHAEIVRDRLQRQLNGEIVPSRLGARILAGDTDDPGTSPESIATADLTARRVRRYKAAARRQMTAAGTEQDA